LTIESPILPENWTNYSTDSSIGILRRFSLISSSLFDSWKLSTLLPVSYPIKYCYSSLTISFKKFWAKSLGVCLLERL
jgi:hypothetical protein